MTLLKHELRQGWKSLIIWTAAIGFFIAVCVCLYPEMKGEMEGVNRVFSSMGMFTDAFGMDRLNFGTLIGFYAIECGNILGIGGVFYASLTAVSILSKEEKDHTAEFLMAHPVSRGRIITEKLLAVLLQIIVMNVLVFGIAVGTVTAIGEAVPWKDMYLLHGANLLVQIELAGICFGISAFLRHGGMGVGIGTATVMYFMNIVANISADAEFLKYITPFGYAESADIIADGCLNGQMVLLGAVFTLVGIALAYWKYGRKDMQ